MCAIRTHLGFPLLAKAVEDHKVFSGVSPDTVKLQPSAKPSQKMLVLEACTRVHNFVLL